MLNKIAKQLINALNIFILLKKSLRLRTKKIDSFLLSLNAYNLKNILQKRFLGETKIVQDI